MATETRLHCTYGVHIQFPIISESPFTQWGITRTDNSKFETTDREHNATIRLQAPPIDRDRRSIQIDYLDPA